MATKTLHIPGWGDFTYDDDSGNEIMSTDGIITCTHTPVASDQVLRYQDVGASGIAAPNSAAFIVVALSGDLTAERRLQVGAGLDLTDGGANGDITVGLDLAYGEIYVYDNTTVDTTLNSTGGKVQVTVFDNNGASNDMTPDHTNDHITVGRTGVYLCTVSASVSNQAGASHKIEVKVWKNNGATALNNLHSDRTLGTGTDTGSLTISGIVSLTAGDTIELWADTDRALDSDVRFEAVTLSLVEIG